MAILEFKRLPWLFGTSLSVLLPNSPMISSWGRLDHPVAEPAVVITPERAPLVEDLAVNLGTSISQTDSATAARIIGWKTRSNRGVLSSVNSPSELRRPRRTFFGSLLSGILNLHAAPSSPSCLCLAISIQGNTPPANSEPLRLTAIHSSLRWLTTT